MEAVDIQMKEKELTQQEAEALIKNKECKGDILDIDLENLGEEKLE